MIQHAWYSNTQFKNNGRSWRVTLEDGTQTLATSFTDTLEQRPLFHDVKYLGTTPYDSLGRTPCTGHTRSGHVHPQTPMMSTIMKGDYAEPTSPILTPEVQTILDKICHEFGNVDFTKNIPLYPTKEDA